MSGWVWTAVWAGAVCGVLSAAGTNELSLDSIYITNTQQNDVLSSDCGMCVQNG